MSADIQVYHNPRCTKSRQAIQLLEEKGVEFEIIEYLKQLPTVEELKAVIAKLGITPFDLIRKGEAIYKSDFKGKTLSDDDWVQAMIDHPKLIERPIVIKGNKAVIGRPTEAVETLL
ncbi:arsenate reductase (glutaredoxin) [Roseivirga misakiensis]|uniref:Arsenate reductase (Glutaredoxin) n=1 Tax=Roseivirga misakiensis TaxID=1563681 RepID=A0A1E5SL55_9BACT|nr:arsenate reductase (glutaredoxin) [Roseivirga misakiensis]OEJ99776.1 arsenate reductase (glutaredoxin) [Roseivirga misakiensis]